MVGVHIDVKLLQNLWELKSSLAFKLQTCEENHFHQFLMEREKINYFWIVEKKTLTEKQVGVYVVSKALSILAAHV